MTYLTSETWHLLDFRHLVQILKAESYLFQSQGIISSYGLGSKEEAYYYCDYNTEIWKSKAGAIEWAKKNG